MSYISQYVHTAPAKPAKKVMAKPRLEQATAPQYHTDKKEALLKITMFIAILLCIVLAVNL